MKNWYRPNEKPDTEGDMVIVKMDTGLHNKHENIYLGCFYDNKNGVDYEEYIENYDGEMADGSWKEPETEEEYNYHRYYVRTDKKWEWDKTKIYWDDVKFWMYVPFVPELVPERFRFDN